MADAFRTQILTRRQVWHCGTVRMTARHFGRIMSALIASLAASSAATAQAPAAPSALYTGNLGGGLAITNGNTDTRNIRPARVHRGSQRDHRLSFPLPLQSGR